MTSPDNSRERLLDASKRALDHFGFSVRALKFLEEVGELQSELAKVLLAHKRANTSKVIDELADVLITIESMVHALGRHHVDAAVARKLERLEAAISDEPGSVDNSDARWIQRIKTLEARLVQVESAARGEL